MIAPSPPVTSRRLLALALPATLANVTTPLLGFVGAAVIGRLGDAALLGAIALGAVAFDAIFWSFGGLRMATAGLTAQAVGAGDRQDVDRTLARALAAGALAGLAIVILQVPIAAAVYAVTGASAEVVAGLSTYFHIRIFAAPFTLANYAILGSTTGRGRTDLGLAIQVAINLTNIALTLLFVLGLDLGIAGAAFSALIADALGALLGLLITYRLGSRLLAVPLAAVLDATALVRTLQVNADIMIRTLALVAGITLFSALGARQGDVVLAANAVLWNLFLIGGFFLDGFATAAETLCGQAIGARDENAFAVAARLSIGWCVGFGIGVAALFLAIGGPFIDSVTTNEAVRAAARADLLPAALAPLVAAVPFAYDGIYIGATWTRAMRNLMLGALTAYAAVMIVLQAFAPGNRSLWLAFLAFLAARGIGQALAFPGLKRRAFERNQAATARAGTASNAGG